MSQEPDAQVIKSALGTHLAYLRAAESGHRAAGRALSQHPELSHLVRMQRSPIARSAAHRARGASFGQRAEFVEQLLDFPVSGLRSLTSSDMRTLQVPAHIGATAVPKQLSEAIAERESTARLAAAKPATRPSTQKTLDPDEADGTASEWPTQSGDAVTLTTLERKVPWYKRGFADILRGRK
ncbi:hypothetical protein [Nesterenkonia haasae]|uniref:hypothetical protein n=1 Tax=Nesterenkonia haasae TaxID=2587813 RepID=UPI001391E856|nr:hypothetical protein [Nesterenkonia haasae]NDK30725.1 hypothetical protein [Nesterenkonia haasae]